MQKFDSQFLKHLSNKASKSIRKRINHNIHLTYDDPLQRLFNAIEPGTYIRPHKHEIPEKRESFWVLKGRILVIEFSGEGVIEDFVVLSRESGIYGVEIPPSIFHTIISLEKGTVALEFKDGPYDPASDKIFAGWAPEEGSPDVENYLNSLLKQTGLIS